MKGDKCVGAISRFVSLGSLLPASVCSI